MREARGGEVFADFMALLGQDRPCPSLQPAEHSFSPTRLDLTTGLTPVRSNWLKNLRRAYSVRGSLSARMSEALPWEWLKRLIEGYQGAQHQLA